MNDAIFQQLAMNHAVFSAVMNHAEVRGRMQCVYAIHTLKVMQSMSEFGRSWKHQNDLASTKASESSK